MSDLTIKEIKKEVQQAENSINNTLKEFTDKTGVSVETLDFNAQQFMDIGTKINIVYSIKLKVILL